MSTERLLSQESRRYSPLLRYSSSGYDEDVNRGNIQREDEEGQSDLGRPRYAPQTIATLAACLAGLTCGMTLAYSSPALPDLEKEYGWNDFQSSWFGSVVTLGAVAGGPLAGTIISRLGRKVTIMSMAVPSTLGWLCILSTGNYIMLLAGRFLTGIAIGIASLSVPIYIAEIASKDIRGLLGAFFLCSATLGVLVANALGITLPWRWLAAATAVVPASMTIIMAFMPESPRWLLSKGQYSQARDSLNCLRGPEYDYDRELHKIHQNIIATDEDFSLRDIFTRKYVRPLIISVGLMAAQQLCGICAIIFYTKEIFESAGFSGDSSIPMLTVSATQFAAAILSSFLMDVAGRRILLILSGILLTISCFTFGLYYYLTIVSGMLGLGWLSLGSAIVFMIGFSLGLGPVPWLMMGELFPVKAQGAACAISTATNYFCSFLVTKEFSDLEKALHKYGAFWLFTGINLLSIIFVAFLVPETKGKTLEEIEREFDNRHCDMPPSDNGTLQPSSA